METTSKDIEKASNFKPEDFKILKLLGKGGYGKVFQVRKVVDDGKVYAMKVLRKELPLSGPNLIQHLVSERNVLALCHSPFLCDLYYTFQTESKLYFILEFISGGDLFTRLEKLTTLSEEDARFYLSEVFLGLEYLHGKDIIYRDLKPDNIMIGKDGHVKLIDFGMCKEKVTENTSASTFCGTSEYMAPEVVRRLNYGKPADVWGFGVLLCDMLMGNPPFMGASKEDTYRNILNANVKVPRHLSAVAKDLINKTLTKNVEKRITMPNIKAHRFFRSVNWTKTAASEVEPPFIPNVVSDDDVSQFCKEFTTMLPLESPGMRVSVADFGPDVFAGFDFNVDGEQTRMPSATQDTLDKIAEKLYEDDSEESDDVESSASIPSGDEDEQ